jgi:hypothetical protein
MGQHWRQDMGSIDAEMGQRPWQEMSIISIYTWVTLRQEIGSNIGGRNRAALVARLDNLEAEMGQHWCQEMGNIEAGMGQHWC